jgi:hypothetical protein
MEYYQFGVADTPESIPQAANISSPLEERIVQMIPFEFKYC